MNEIAYLTVKDVATRHRRSPRTIRDWITHGCVTPHGRIRLEAIRAGKKYSVSSEALEIFEARLRHSSQRTPLDTT
ncbi:DNA-binding protein [Amaricoccus tamworthensis]|uniref:DNA-binding protein n=1 Tax=Amaricoccus tamworthensis TaxID=57002 RepID=UPI003C79E564